MLRTADLQDERDLDEGGADGHFVGSAAGVREADRAVDGEDLGTMERDLQVSVSSDSSFRSAWEEGVMCRDEGAGEGSGTYARSRRRKVLNRVPGGSGD